VGEEASLVVDCSTACVREPELLLEVPSTTRIGNVLNLGGGMLPVAITFIL